MRLKTFAQSLKESGGYPPGAANDPNAPYNQKSPDYETEKIDGHVWSKDKDPIELPVKITYTYWEDGSTKMITDYDYEYVNPTDKEKAQYPDDDVREEISNHAGKHEFQ